jgi:hypothetical protein
MIGQVYKTANKKATATTVQLYNNLFRILPKGLLFGHQDDLAYGLGWEYIHLWRDGGLVNGTGKYRFASSQDHYIPVGRDPSFMDVYKLYISDKFIFEKKARELKLYK